MTDGQGSVVIYITNLSPETSRQMTRKLVSGVYTDDRVINTTRAAYETMNYRGSRSRRIMIGNLVCLADLRTDDKFVRAGT